MFIFLVDQAHKFTIIATYLIMCLLHNLCVCMCSGMNVSERNNSRVRGTAGRSQGVFGGVILRCSSLVSFEGRLGLDLNVYFQTRGQLFEKKIICMHTHYIDTHTHIGTHMHTHTHTTHTHKKNVCVCIDAFELWCWRRLLRVPWTASSNQSILKKVSPEYSLEGLIAPILWPPDANN